jgi:methylated-DNA-protein-cysteine methyltransferase-like protein
MPRHSRHVGQGKPGNLQICKSNSHELIPHPALKFLSPNTNPPVPWYRVVSSSGTISSRGPGTEGARRQRDELEAEGVEVSTGRTGEMRIDFVRWGWFPQVGSVGLPDGMSVANGGEEEEESD